MTEPKYKSCVLFGGNGFIGSNFAAHILDNNIAEKVTLSDICTPTPDMWPRSLQQRFAAGEIDYVKIDVRTPITKQSGSNELPKDVDLIVNLAAVHKEPGHIAEEYFQTNLPGAENVCDWANQVGCDRIIFTSSIATYGGNNSTKNEDSLTMPSSPYGISKLTAEKIHLAWQQAKPNRKLMIVRPGVIFGAGERGNVTRMVKAVLGHYFFFMGNKGVRKAGGYVKELCRSMAFMLNWQEENNQAVSLFNFTMNPTPTVGDYANGIKKVAEVKRSTPNLPYWLLLLASYVIHSMNTILRRKQSISPVTVRKVLKYNNIEPKVLKELGYEYEYTLEQGLADWYKERPLDW